MYKTQRFSAFLKKKKLKPTGLTWFNQVTSAQNHSKTSKPAFQHGLNKYINKSLLSFANLQLSPCSG